MRHALPPTHDPSVWRQADEAWAQTVRERDALLAALKWAMRHLRSHISFGERGDVYDRVSGQELAGFASKWDAVEAAIAAIERRR